MPRNMIVNLDDILNNDNENPDNNIDKLDFFPKDD